MGGESPCLIAVMGCTGAGKSSFIRLVTGSNHVHIGHRLKSMTSEIECFEFEHRGRSIIIVDTPGFDDSTGSDREILMKLLRWLKDRYKDNQRLSGILYLYRIDAPRMQGSALRNFGTFKQLCGEQFYKNVILGTTCWDLVDAETTGKAREAQLSEKGGFWSVLAQKGSEIVRIPRESDAAKDLVLRLASKDATFLKSQDEMGRMGLSLDQVSATKTINTDLEAVKAENERAKREQQDIFQRMQRRREEKIIAQCEKDRKCQEKLLQEQEQVRQRLLEVQREKEAKRAKEMKDIEEKMRQARLEETKEREKERREAQERLDDQQFSLDYQILIRAKESKLIKARILTFLKICGHCSRPLEHEDYRECPADGCQIHSEPFRLCEACRPLPGVYCPGGRLHWKGMTTEYVAEQKPSATIGSESCFTCDADIGPMGFQCNRYDHWMCLECVKNQPCCSGTVIWIRRLGR